MDIIFHGKPNSNSIYATPGINSSLQKKITDTFFESRGGIPNDKALVVETYFWQQKWYSVYTFSLAKLKGNEGRSDSYFSISLVFSNAFILLTSAVYQCLEDTYSSLIENKLISNAGKYLVQDFTDKQYFESLIKHIQTNFANLQDPLDNSFSANRSNQEIRYNLQDCDAQTFIRDLKTHGRILVGAGELFPKMCAASVMQSKEQQIESLNAKVSEQKKAMDKLAKDMEEAQNTANSNANNSSATIKNLKADIERLQTENKEAKSKISIKQQELDDLVQKIQELVPASPKKPVREEIVETKQEKPLFERILNYIPLLNSVLLIVVCLCVLFAQAPQPNPDDIKITELKKEINRLKEDNKKKDAKIKEQAKTIQSFKDASHEPQQNGGEEKIVQTVGSKEQSDIDIDCGVQIKDPLTQNAINKSGSIKNGDMVSVRWIPREGYQWHCTNLHDSCATVLKTNTKGEATIPLRWVQYNKQKKDLKIYMTYRRSNKNKANQNNIIILTIQ